MWIWLVPKDSLSSYLDYLNIDFSINGSKIIYELYLKDLIEMIIEYCDLKKAEFIKFGINIIQYIIDLIFDIPVSTLVNGDKHKEIFSMEKTE